MAVFEYKAIDKNKKIVSGLIEATNEAGAIDLLEQKNLTIIYIAEEKPAASFDKLKQLSFFSKVKPKDIVVFSRQFAVMISANVALVQALRIISDQTDNPKLKQVVVETANEIDAGSRLSDALTKHPKAFSDFYISVVRSGETSGKLDEVLTYLADEMEKDFDMMSKIKGAMIYPAFVGTGMLGVGAMMMIFVVPKLTGIMQETGAELPIATKILISFSDFLANYWWLLLGSIVGIIAGLKYYIKTEQGKRVFDRVILYVPIFGKLLRRIYLVRFTRSMNTLIVGGVTITQGLKITADVVNNSVYKALIEETIKEVEEGNSISSVMLNSKEFPTMVSQMIGIGEKTGKLDLILKNVTDFYSREIANIVANLMTLMEPIIMVVMGIAVGGMVAAIIMPMYNMASSF